MVDGDAVVCGEGAQVRVSRDLVTRAEVRAQRHEEVHRKPVPDEALHAVPSGRLAPRERDPRRVGHSTSLTSSKTSANGTPICAPRVTASERMNSAFA